MTTPLKNSANNFDGSGTDTFISTFDSFFLIGFKLVILIQVIQVLQKSNLLIEGHAIYPKHYPNTFELMILLPLAHQDHLHNMYEQKFSYYFLEIFHSL